MPSINYPSSLPNVKMDAYSFKPGNTNIRTDFEGGLARTRRRFLSAPTDITVEWEFTLNEFGIFERFYDVDCLNGSAWFNINLVNGVGETSYAARFKEPYSVKTLNREFSWGVSGVLEVLSRPISGLEFDAAEFDINDFS